MGFNGISTGFHENLVRVTWWITTRIVTGYSSNLGWFTYWLFNIAMENCPFIDDFPIKTSIYKGFSMAMLNNQMVNFTIPTDELSFFTGVGIPPSSINGISLGMGTNPVRSPGLLSSVARTVGWSWKYQQPSLQVNHGQNTSVEATWGSWTYLVDWWWDMGNFDSSGDISNGPNGSNFWTFTPPLSDLLWWENTMFSRGR